MAFAPASAQIRINEIFPNPVGSNENGWEWIEIYNSGVGSVDLTGWAIDDAVTIGQTAVRARIPEDFDFSKTPGLLQESREKLLRVRPRSLGQASRISGVTPADISVLMVALDAQRRRETAASTPG